MRSQDYTVGWICAIKTEYVAASAMLDEEHPPLTQQPGSDSNAYTLGRIAQHNVVIACLPKGKYGVASAASVATEMLRTFESIRIGLMVGIGGGVPQSGHDIRLGDVVVGAPQSLHGGVVAYDFGKALQHREFEITRSLNAPPKILLTALTRLEAYHELKGMGRLQGFLSRVTDDPRLRKRYRCPGAEEDRLYDAGYTHLRQGEPCQVACDERSRQQREPRDVDEGIVVHYGLIASADRVIKDARLRDRLSKKHSVLCFETEAAGLMDNFPCVVIRGICDYADSHKNDTWQGYAAASAAAYATELLHTISTGNASQEMMPIASFYRFEHEQPRDILSIEYQSSMGGPVSHAALTSPSYRALSPPPALEEISIVEQINTGQRCLDDKAGMPDLAMRLREAETHFSRALTRLRTGNPPDVESLILVYNSLTRVELNKTLIKAHSLEMKRASLRRAFQFNQGALDNAILAPTQGEEVPRVLLRKAILVARQTEIESRLPGLDPQLVYQWKTKALEGLQKAKHDVEISGNSEVNRKLIVWANGWISILLRIVRT